MIRLGAEKRRRVFAVWLRTGRVPPPYGDGGVELKFNPYHDPRNGRFTFAPVGGQTGPAERDYTNNGSRSLRHAERDSETTTKMSGGTRPVLRTMPPTGHVATARLAAAQQEPMVGRGANARAFDDPMTLEQSFPGLRDAPAGSIVAVADSLFDLTGPATAMTVDVLQDMSSQLTSQIKGLDPTWHYDEMLPTDALGKPIRTVQGLTAKVNDLRFQRAVIIARISGDYKPLQVETLRVVQQRADRAYERGEALLKAGALAPRLSEREALGNFVDRQVRHALRWQYAQLGIDSAGAGPVRVNRRENTGPEDDRTYRLPDIRVDDVAFDITLTRKTLSTAQIRGFFASDFRPARVVIIRPRQIGGTYTYVIPRSEPNHDPR